MSNLKYKPAFPTDSERQNGENSYHFEGMTFREYAACQVVQGLITYENGERLTKLFDRERQIPDNGETPQQWFARIAITLADALIAELEKPADQLWLVCQPAFNKGIGAEFRVRDMAEAENIVRATGPQAVKPFLKNDRGETVAFVRTD